MRWMRLKAAAGLFAAIACLTAAQAQSYPSHSITLISPCPAGGAIDALCRALAAGMNDRLGQSMVVENRPGAGSVIGTASGAKAAPDGYTLVVAGSGSLAISPALYKQMPYDAAKDFAPVALVAQIPFVLVVNEALPIKSIGDLVAYAKANPGKLSYGSGGPGSPHHLYAELLKTQLGIEMTHVPYKGSAPALNDVVAGHVQLMFSDTVPALPLIAAGKVRALGVSSKTRLPAAPEIPPLDEAGVPGFDVAGWGMVVAPAGTPREIVDKLYVVFKAAVAQPDVQQQVNRLGIVLLPATDPPEKLQAYIDAEMARWGDVVRKTGLAGSEG